MNPIQFYEFGKNVYLKFTQQFDNAYWLKVIPTVPLNSASITANSITAPDGTTTADKLFNNSGASRVCLFIDSQYRIQSGQTYTISIYAKAGVSGVFQLCGRDTPFGTQIFANFDLITGLVTLSGSSTTARMQLDNNGWYRCAITGTSIAKSGNGAMSIGVVATALTMRQHPSNPTDEVYLWGAKIEKGATATDYKNEFTQAVYTGASPL